MLHGKIPVPKVYDILYRDGNTYLIMEYIEGITWVDYLSNRFGERTYAQLKDKEKIELIDYEF